MHIRPCLDLAAFSQISLSAVMLLLEMSSAVSPLGPVVNHNNGRPSTYCFSASSPQSFGSAVVSSLPQWPSVITAIKLELVTTSELIPNSNCRLPKLTSTELQMLQLSWGLGFGITTRWRWRAVAARNLYFFRLASDQEAESCGTKCGGVIAQSSDGFLCFGAEWHI